MSELRTQLDHAKRDHLAARYPGDLAADLLHRAPPARLPYATPARRPWLFWTNVGALGAVAATIALVMWRLHPAATLTPPTTHQPTAAVWQPRPADEFSVVPQLAGASLTPQTAGLVPSPATVVPAPPTTLVPPTATALSIPAMPSFPSLTDILTPSTTDTDTEDNNTTNHNNHRSQKETT